MLVLCYLVLMTYIVVLLIAKRRFDAAQKSIRYRIHVNGIRGKSTVTRYVAAILRDAGIRTYGKTTGTAARVIMPDGSDALVQRKGYANVNEQLRMMHSFSADKAQAVVMECMAINPDYQDWLESKAMRSHIVIITNVRLDHQEEMGQELTDIARSLARSIPERSILITAEQRPELLRILAEECVRKSTRLLQAPIEQVNPADLKQFGHVAHKDNIAIGLAVARLFKIKPKQAMAAMAAAPADPGAFQVQSFKQQGKQIKWANLFAVNDKESFAAIASNLAKAYPDHYRIALLNNRHDRPSRVEMFSKLAQGSLKANAIVALGDYEERVKKSISAVNTKVALLGNRSANAKSNGRELTDKIVALADQPKVLMIGTVNIHTQQSENILEHIATATNSNSMLLPPDYITAAKRQSRLPGFAKFTELLNISDSKNPEGNRIG